VLPGIDGEKMSKSYGNTIDPFEAEKPLRKRILSIKTDGTGMLDRKDADACSVFRIFRALAGSDDARTAALRQRYEEPASYSPEGFGYGHAKQALYELILDHFAAARGRRAALMADPAAIDRVLAAGAAKARAVARDTVDKARRAVGLA
jgi:tryptophanyl-tRNA synthetase